MSDLTLNVEKQFSLCGLSLQTATCLCTAVQFMAAAVLGIFYKLLLDSSMMISILLSIHLFCSGMALTFLVFCLVKRKFGTFYEVLLHAYLLSILIMGLASFFVFLFLPLAFLQQPHSLGESLHFAFLWISSAAVLTGQFFQKNLVEQMLPVMEHYYT